MTTEAKPVGSPVEKESSKGIPASDFKAFKEGALKREKKLKEQLEERDAQIASLQGELRIVKMDVDDADDVKAVKAHLLERESKLNSEVTKHQKDLTSFIEREKKVRAQELAAEYKEKGLTVDVESLLSAEDMDRVIMDKYTEFLAEENQKLKTAKTSESGKSVFETGAASVSRKQPADMTDEELVVYANKLDIQAEAAYDQSQGK